jgi:tetratricopeptide (TPR) repeat protein
MRLLERSRDGELSLTEDLIGDNIPLYAILSHTWGPSTEEVTFEDLVDGTGKDKAGYDKIRFCEEQARCDGLRYFWVDTCCINKSNNNELSEAINSMFRWYRDAARCYVYLSDISTTGREQNGEQSEPLWEPAFRASRWFTRGWTLQELIAPKSVEFFTRGGQRLGDKISLEQQIHKITGIAVLALQGTPLSQFEVDERLKWAETRQTTREEDCAYCLLGIFGVFMPLIYGEGRDNAIRRLRKEIDETLGREDMSNRQKGTLPTPEPTFANSYKARTRTWIVPFERNSCFTGREPELTKLQKALFIGNQTTKIAITGLGGVGKTQLALELVYRVSTKYKHCSVIWIPATNEESLEQAYLDIAKQLGISGYENDKADVKKLVQSHLSDESVAQWLLVFDNADDIGLWTDTSRQGSKRLIDYLPQNKRGSIIFTTRDKKTAVKLAPRGIVEVPEMDETVGKQLLQKCLIDQDLINNQADVTALLVQLTYLPLAIIQATAYINENGISLGDYLSLLAEKEEEVIDLLSEEFMDEGRYRDVKNPVATTWLISFEQIHHRDPLAADYLSFMACVDPKDIPWSLLPPGQSRKMEIEAIGTLKAYSFITNRSENLAVDIHRLVHLTTRNWLREKGRLLDWTSRVIVRLAELLADSGNHNRVVWRSYLPHVYYMLGPDLVNKDIEDKIELLWRYGICLYLDGRYNEAEGPFKQVMETRMRVLGEDHPDTLTSMANLASTYRNQGRWRESESLGVQVMETSMSVLGEDHPDTLASMANLASTYRNQGRWRESESLGVQVMETSMRVLGEDHPDTLTIMANLASTYWNQGRWREAESLGVQVMETSMRVLGEEHPHTLTSMANLASTYRNQGRWREAESLGVQVMETSMRVLGEDHPDTLAIMANLASTYRNQGRWREAESLELQVMETRIRVLGEQHPHTLTSMANLASTYRNQGRWGESEDLQTRELEICSRVLGEEHPHTLTSMANLASIRNSQGRHADALALIWQCFHLRQQVLGPDHPYTKSTLSTLNAWQEASNRLQNNTIDPEIA